ncbi:hypothetical protein IWW48_004739 [Coemansia sp. RSA 1200]|nr:hypothetical protein IWW48_004739 [Coemansia sp. RSA 1200]
MDKATASVDFDTDNRIQNTIRGSEFANSTLLCIAHRLRKIIDYDKVLVLKDGKVAVYIGPVRRRLGRLFFQMVITTALAHGGRNVGANLELQAQHLALSAITSSYILVFQGIVVGLGRNSSINFDVAARITHALALAIFCFAVASIYTYTPRLAIPMKINATAVYLAFTVYPAQRSFIVRPLPGYIYAQLLGAAVSTIVNIFVMPSTSGRDLVSRLSCLLKTMTECCDFFNDSVADLGRQDHQRSKEALAMRASLHSNAENLGQTVSAARYETMIDRYSQHDYHHIFLSASELATSFSSMCLPLGIDRHFYYHLQDPSARMAYGSMASIYDNTSPDEAASVANMQDIHDAATESGVNKDSNQANSGSQSRNPSHLSVTSYAGENRARSKTPAAEPGVQRLKQHQYHHHHASSVDLQKTLRDLAEHHMRMEIRTKSARLALVPIRRQIGLHRTILHVLLSRSQSLEHSSPAKSLFNMVARSVKSICTRKHYKRAGMQGFGANGGEEAEETEEDGATRAEIGADAFAAQYIAAEEAGASEELDAQLVHMGLSQLARIVDAHARLFEKKETAHIGRIAPYSTQLQQDDQPTHEKNVLLLSFIGILRENAICLAKLLRVLAAVNAVRPDYVQLWLPSLSWHWLNSQHGANEDDNNTNSAPQDEDWDLEKAFDDGDSADGYGWHRSDSEYDSESGAESNEETESECDSGSNNKGKEAACSTDEEEAGLHIHITRSRATGASSKSSASSKGGSSSKSSSRRASAKKQHHHHHRQQIHYGGASAGAIYTLIDNRYARVARFVLDWSRRPKTLYAVKFTATMMAWAVWAYIYPIHDFFVRNNGSWGLTCISAVFGVTIGSTVRAGASRLLASSLSGGWAIVTWKAGSHGSDPFLSCVCLGVYFVVAMYAGFFVRRWAAVGPVMVISLASVLFTSYSVQSERDAISLGWKHVVVNAIAILFATGVSAVFMPHRARAVLRLRLADVLRLNSRVVQSINHMHVARANFDAAYRSERRRARDFATRSRVLIAKCRALIPPAIREPGVHERFQAAAHARLIDTLELQLEWLLYSFFTHSVQSSPALRAMIRRALPMREDIVGAKSAFNSMLASALSARTRLPAYLPDIATARDSFVQSIRPLLRTTQYASSFEITYLARWDVGIWHLIASQAALSHAVRAIVGAETDCWPETVGFMLDTLETAQAHAGKTLHERWFSRLPKYYDPRRAADI